MTGDNTHEDKPSPPAWTAYSTDRDRIKAIAVAVERPRTTAWISSESLVAKRDAQPILDDLVNDGVLVKTTGEDGESRYRADPGWVREETLDALRRCNDREDLEDMRDEIHERLSDVQDGARYRLLKFRLGLIEDELDAPHADE